MKYKSLKSRLIYLSLLVSLITILLNYWAIPFLTEIFPKYFNLFTATVIILLLTIFIGGSNKMDFKLEAGNTIYVSKAVIVIMAIELLISLNFHLLDYLQDRIFAYAICLTPSFGFILSRPLLRLYFIESKLERMDKDSQSK
jgi:hypothetical protein